MTGASRIAAAALAACLPLGGASAQATGRTIVELCGARDRSSEMACGLYVLGIVQGYRLAAEAAGRQAICLPAGVDGFRLRDTVLAALGADPAREKEPAAPLVVAVLQDAFPCPAP